MMEIFEKIFSISSYYLAFYFEFINISNLTNEKHSFKIEDLFLVGLIASFNYLLTLNGIIPIKMIFSFISIFLIGKYIVKINFKESLIITVLYYIIILIIEYACSIVLIDVLKFNLDKFLISVGIQKCIVGHIINIVTYILCKIRVANKFYQLLCDIIVKLKITTGQIFFFSSALFVIHLMYMNNITGKLNILYVVLYVLIFIVFIFLIVSFLYRNYYLKILNNILLENDRNMKKILDEYRLFQHNIKNDLLAISSIGSKKVKEIINEYMVSYHLSDGINDNISSMPNGLQGVMYQKLISKNNTSANVIVDNFIISDPIDTLNIKEYRRLIECFGIILDNALEAIFKSDKEYIYVYLNEDSNNYIIKCINTFSSNIEIDSLMSNGGTTKKGHLGLGMNYIKNRSNFGYTSKIINNKFYSELVIKKVYR